MIDDKKCSVDGCNCTYRIQKINGNCYCNKHAIQMYRYGKTFKSMYEPNEFKVCDDYAEIYIRNAKGDDIAIAIIDIEDIELCKQYKWSMTKDGYILSGTNKKFVYLHRLLMNAQKGEYVDHINFNTLDNRKSNLRITTNAQNLQHRSSLSKNNTSGYHGIIFEKRRQKWRVEIQHNNKTHFIGYFNSIDDAVIARKKAEKEYFKEYVSFFALDNNEVDNYEFCK